MEEQKKIPYTSFGVQLHDVKDAEIIAEVNHRKKKYGVAASKTLRKWIRLGYVAEKESEDELD